MVNYMRLCCVCLCRAAGYLPRLLKAPGPSAAATDVKNFMAKEQVKEPLLCNLRPHTAAIPVPVQLLVPPFVGIITAAWDSSSPSGAEHFDMCFALDLCIAMSRSYNSEELRRQKLVHMLRKYLGDQYMVIAAVVGNREPDVSVMTNGQRLMQIEVKNERGVSGDAALQGQLYYADYVKERPSLLSTSYLPMLQLEVVGPSLCVTGLAFVTDKPVCQPLTPILHLLALHQCHQQQVGVVMAVVACGVKQTYKSQCSRMHDAC